MERITWNKVNDIFLNKLLRRPFLLQNSLFLTVPPCISDRSSGARATSFPGLYFSLAPGGGKKRDPGNEADAGAKQRTRARNHKRARLILPATRPNHFRGRIPVANHGIVMKVIFSLLLVFIQMSVNQRSRRTLCSNVRDRGERSRRLKYSGSSVFGQLREAEMGLPTWSHPYIKSTFLTSHQGACF